MLKISLDFNPDATYKGSRFSKILPKKGFEFIPSRKNSTITLNWSFVLLLAKIDLILEEQDEKKDTLRARSTDYVKIVFILLTKVVTLYMKAIILQVGISGLKTPILECKVCFPIFIPLNKQF